MTTPAKIESTWVILVGGGYGAFLFEGTEIEAEAMRSHKAQWEAAVALKRSASIQEVCVDIASQCWNHPLFQPRKYNYVCHCGECKP